MSQIEWNKLLESGIIKTDTVLSQIFMNKEEAVKKVHKNAISNLSDGRVGTYVPDESKKSGRRNVKAQDKAELIEKLYDFYISKNQIKEGGSDKLRLCDIFEEWLIYKSKKKKNKLETIKQNRASYEKYVANTILDQKKLTELSTFDLEDWAIDVLSETSMTAHTFNNHKIVVMAPLAYAKKRNYIKTNPWVKEELEYKQLFMSKRKKPSDQMVFYPDEIEEICHELEYGYANNGNVANIALEINFDLGLRVGELSAIKWSDINWKNNTIFIQREEDSTEQVEEYVKSDASTGYRELALSDSIIRLLRRLIADRPVLSEYVFCDKYGTRLLNKQICNRLVRVEMKVGMSKRKETHCIRRTVASRMNANHIPLEEIRRWLGHTDVKTTLTYLYNPYREDETMERIKNCSILSTNKECLQVSSKKVAIFDQEKMLKTL